MHTFEPGGQFFEHPSYLARLQLFDLAIDLERSWVFNVASSASRSFNSPILGETLKGRAVLTIASGEITHEEL